MSQLSADEFGQIPPNAVHRPWGWYASVQQGDCFQVKVIVVNPGASLSLQSHNHRAEHWVVVEGTAHVTLHTEVVIALPNQYVFIPIGAKHRLENHSALPLRLIEVQHGSYLGEDDIVRYSDLYGRTDSTQKNAEKSA